MFLSKEEQNMSYGEMDSREDLIVGGGCHIFHDETEEKR